MTTDIRGRLVTGDHDLPDAVLVVEDGRVVSVEPAGDGPAERLVLPGLFDIHCHGGGGASLTTGDPDQIRAAAAHHLANGSTSLVGSVVTDAPDRMLAAVDALADAVDEGVLVGIHLEGPFLNAERCGAQDPRWLLDPDADLTARLLDAGRGHVRVITIAPELPGADEVADLAVRRGVVAAVGHTTAASARARQFLAEPGHGLVTHLFNGMPPFHHREPGPVGGSLAAAAAGRARVELIADGVHVDDEAATTVFELLGRERVVLVSDAMSAAGMSDGDYELGPLQVTVRDGVARLAHGESIAGGTARVLDIVRRLVATDLPTTDVVAAATTNPAAAIGLDGDRGSLRVGQRADLVVTDQRLQPVRVMRAGEWVR
jgi:N-acetylglucosamine-6-phosphate deacetylase